MRMLIGWARRRLARRRARTQPRPTPRLSEATTWQPPPRTPPHQHPRAALLRTDTGSTSGAESPHLHKPRGHGAAGPAAGGGPRRCKFDEALLIKAPIVV